jgi:UDP-N-acetylmuramyl pentapeptide phosphotransferase/UDP-N-acetylglucosamine-1-phosphate transferase
MTSTLIWAVSAILGTSFLVCAFLVLTQRWHGRLSLDHDVSGTQKFHAVPVPRIGGMGLMVGLAIGVVVGHFLNGQTYRTAILLVAAALPIFIAGLLEDTTKRVSPKARLIASIASAGMAIALLNTHLTRIDVPFLDSMMAWTPLAIMFTCFAVSGMTNAVNIIDGFNGLASGSVALMLAGLSAVAWQADDTLVMRLCLWGVAATLGFMLLNFPFGKIFLGDSGAYLAGFWLAQCAIMLLARNPDISTWAVLLCCVYPVWETVFSIWRKSVYRKTGMSNPDKVHFHMLVYRRLVSRWIPRTASQWKRHALTSTFIWLLVSLCQLASYVLLVNFSNANLPYILGIACFAIAYGMIYRSLLIHQDNSNQIDLNPSKTVSA